MDANRIERDAPAVPDVAPIAKRRGRPPGRVLTVQLAPVKVSPEQAAKYTALGGPAWLRAAIDAAWLPPKK